MAAPIRGYVSGLLKSGVRPTSLVTVRNKSDGKYKDGPPAWAPQQVPTGQTFWAISLTKMQNRDLWPARMEHINAGWKKIMVEHQKTSEAMKEEKVAELFMVKLVKSLKGRPKTEKKILEDLGIKVPNHPVITKNKTTTNNMLYKVKHLVDILPIRFPYGLPSSEADYEHCYLCDNGEFVVVNKLSTDSDRIETTEPEESLWELKQDFIDQINENKKMKYSINQEYFPTEYIYEYNQDKKEHRYDGNHNIGADKKWY